MQSIYPLGGLTIMTTPSPDQKARLEPCPFCNSGAYIVEENNTYMVACSMCMCNVGEATNSQGEADHVFESEDAAVDAWNTRSLADTASYERCKAEAIEACLNAIQGEFAEAAAKDEWNFYEQDAVNRCLDSIRGLLKGEGDGKD
jgi:hypothetical protein